MRLELLPKSQYSPWLNPLGVTGGRLMASAATAHPNLPAGEVPPAPASPCAGLQSPSAPPLGPLFHSALLPPLIPQPLVWLRPSLHLRDLVRDFL